MTYVEPRRWDVPDEDADYTDEPAGGARGSVRWGGVLAGLLLALLGAGGALWLGSGRTQMVDVVALARAVDRGQVIEAGDLAVVRVAADGGQVRLASPAAARVALVGHQALIDLPAGTLLTPELVGSVAGPAGTVTLGVTVDPAGLPSSGLRPGDLVDVVGVDPVSKAPVTLASTVTVTEVRRASGATGDGTTVVYLAVDAQVAPQVAAAAAQDPGVRLLGVTAQTTPELPDSTAASIGPTTASGMAATTTPAAGTVTVLLAAEPSATEVTSPARSRGNPTPPGTVAGGAGGSVGGGG